MGEMDNLTLSGGRTKKTAPRRRGPIGAIDRRQGLRNSLRRSNRNLRGALRRIRGKGGLPEEEKQPESESLVVTQQQQQSNNNAGETDYNNQSSKLINELDSDDNDDFLDPKEYIDYSHNGGEASGKKEEKEDPSSHDEEEEEDHKVHGKHGNKSDHSDFESDDDDHDDDENDHNDDGHWGRYDDEYENSVDDSLHGDDEEEEEHPGAEEPYRDGENFHDIVGEGYKDGEHRQDHGSPRNNGGRRSSFNRRGGLLKQLSKKMLRRKSKNTTSNLDHTTLVTSNSAGDDPYWSPKSPAKGRIEGFGSTAPDFTSPRTLRQKLKDFRENRIAARKDKDDGMKQMDVVGAQDDPQKKNWKEKIESVVDAMVDASISEPELQGYMTSTSQTVTKSSSTTTPTNTPVSTKDASKMSYLRKQFGDDNAYIVYLEGEKVAGELELLSHRNRIKELEAETRRLKGIEEKEGGDGDTTSVASDSSNVGEGAQGDDDEKESEIEWQTGVPEEGVLIDLLDEGTTTATTTTTIQGTSTKSWPIQLPLTEQVVETGPQTDNLVSTGQSTGPLPTPPQEQIQETPNDTTGIDKNASEQTEGLLVDLTVRDQARDIVDSILADVLNEKKATSLIGGDPNNNTEDSLLTLKVEPSAVPELSETTDATNTPSGQEDTITTSAPMDLLPELPVDAPPPPPTDEPPQPPVDGFPDLKEEPATDVPLEPPADTSIEILADAPPVPPTADLPPETTTVAAPPLPPANLPPDESTNAETVKELKETSAASEGTTTTIGTEAESMETKPAEIIQNPMSAEVAAVSTTEPTVVEPEAPSTET